MGKTARTQPTQPRTSLREIDWKAPDLLCPECGTCSITVHLCCDVWDRYCAVVASCSHCKSEFDAKELSTYSERYEELSRIAQDEICPVCDESSFRLQSLCDRKGRTCFFLLICQPCGNVKLR